MTLPFELTDVEGYPTEAWLEYIKQYFPSDEMPLIEFIEQLTESWWGGERQFKLHRPYGGIQRLELHTGGWSGNEAIIEAVLSNGKLVCFPLQYVMWKRGGHYYFEITTKNN